MERWFRALAAYAEDLAAVPSTDMVAHNSKPRGRGIQHFLLTSLSTRRAYGVHAYKQAKRSHTQNKVSKYEKNFNCIGHLGRWCSQ